MIGRIHPTYGSTKPSMDLGGANLAMLKQEPLMKASKALAYAFLSIVFAFSGAARAAMLLSATPAANPRVVRIASPSTPEDSGRLVVTVLTTAGVSMRTSTCRTAATRHSIRLAGSTIQRSPWARAAVPCTSCHNRLGRCVRGRCCGPRRLDRTSNTIVAWRYASGIDLPCQQPG